MKNLLSGLVIISSLFTFVHYGNCVLSYKIAIYGYLLLGVFSPCYFQLHLWVITLEKDNKMDIYDIIEPIAKLAEDQDKKIKDILMTMYQLGLINEKDLQSLEDHYDYLNNVHLFADEYYIGLER